MQIKKFFFRKCKLLLIIDTSCFLTPENYVIICPPESSGSSTGRVGGVGSGKEEWGEEHE